MSKTMALIILNKRFQFRSLIKKKVLQFQTHFYFCSSVASDKNINKFPNILQAKWDELKDEAEKIIGCKVSSIYTQNFINESFLDLWKSVSSGFPRNKSIKNIITDITRDNQPWGLIILLLSTATTNQSLSEPVKSLAQIVESIKYGFQAYHGITNTDKASNIEDELQNNKVYLILGDNFIARAHYALAELKNSEVYFTISTALKILTESEFIGVRDVQNKPLPNIATDIADEFKNFDLLSLDVVFGKAKREWTVRNLFNGVDLLGRGCQTAMMLTDQNAEVQHRAYRFGYHVGLSLQAATELQNFISNNNEQFCLISAPVLFALEENPKLYTIIDKAKNDIKNINYEVLKFNISKTQAVDKTKILYEDHAKKATKHINSFGESESAEMLKKIINIL